MTTPALRLVSHSRLETFRQCMRKGYYSYIRGWTREGANIAATFGSSWHQGLDVIWANHKAEGAERKAIIDQAYQAFLKEWTDSGLAHPDDMSPDDFDNLGAKSPPIALEMYFDYWDAREHIFLDPSFKLIDIERPFAVPLDPNDPTLFYVGKMDKIFEYRRQLLCGEHKTTGSYAVSGVFRREYIDSFTPNAQCDGYLYALYLMSRQGDFGEEHLKARPALWVDAALTHKKVRGFKIIPIERKMEHLEEWLWNVMTWVDQVEQNTAALAERAGLDTPYMAAFPQNTSSCGNYAGCTYRELCRALPNPEKERDIPLGFVQKNDSTFQKLKLEKIFPSEAVDKLSKAV